MTKKQRGKCIIASEGWTPLNENTVHRGDMTFN